MGKTKEAKARQRELDRRVKQADKDNDAADRGEGPFAQSPALAQKMYELAIVAQHHGRQQA